MTFCPGNGVDWGRESFVFSGNIWCFQTVFSPSVKNLRFLPPPSSEGGLGFCVPPRRWNPRQREAWVSAFLHAGGTLIRGSASRDARYKTGNSQRQAKSCSFPRREKGKRKVFLAVEEEMCYNKKSNVDMLCPLMRKYRKKAFERFFKRECEVGFPKCMENGIFRQS